MGSRATLAGVEVPFIATDTVKWIELSVPLLDGDGGDGVAVTLTSATATCEDGCASSCSVIGVDPPQYFIWKIHQKQPCILELLQLSTSHSIVTGLRITFPHSLSPFSYICHNHNEMSGSSAAHPYLLYALSVSGVAYLFQLKNLSSYSSLSVFPTGDIVPLNLRSYYSSSNAAPASPIVSVTAAAGCLVVGRCDGYVSYFQLGSLHPNAPGFVHDLRDDLGIGRLWSYVSRGRNVGAVQDLGIAKVHGLLLLSDFSRIFAVISKCQMDVYWELERVFSAMSLKCCRDKVGSSSYAGMHGLLLTSGTEETTATGLTDACMTSSQSKGNSQWETLKLYLEKYKAFHAGLPVTVAETLLRTDSHMELPLWLVHIFKDVRRGRTWGMSGQESSPSSLFQLYVNYGRYMEATNMLLEYTESFASVRPSDLINRKKSFVVWFPYTTIERLWCQLEECIEAGHMIDQCEKLKKLLQGALKNHLKQLKVDSDDALASAAC